jgi:hypothetical protein
MRTPHGRRSTIDESRSREARMISGLRETTTHSRLTTPSSNLDADDGAGATVGAVPSAPPPLATTLGSLSSQTATCSEIRTAARPAAAGRPAAASAAGEARPERAGEARPVGATQLLLGYVSSRSSSSKSSRGMA